MHESPECFEALAYCMDTELIMVDKLAAWVVKTCTGMDGKEEAASGSNRRDQVVLIAGDLIPMTSEKHTPRYGTAVLLMIQAPILS